MDGFRCVIVLTVMDFVMPVDFKASWTVVGVFSCRLAGD